uniref:Uncharacterized protein n=1 Tax=Arundo donax TaxID=35708 RepID=A0A0A9GX18_ARUDO
MSCCLHFFCIRLDLKKIVLLTLTFLGQTKEEQS